MSLRLAVATEDLGTSFKKAIGIATTCAVPGVRLNARTEVDAANATDSSLRQIRHYVRERQMNVAGLVCPTRHALHDMEYLEPRIEIIRKSMSIARKLGTSELLIRCGRIPNPESSQETQTPTDDVHSQANPFSFDSAAVAESETPEQEFSRLCEVLRDLADFGNHTGCTLNLQVNSYDAHLINRLLSEVTTGPLNIVMDTATAIMTGTNPEKTYREFYQRIGYVRARDALRDGDGAGSEVCIGHGVVDWMQIIPTLVEANFRGWICVERTGGENRADDVRHGVKVLKELIPQSGS